ncbi:MFS transporter [Persephonella sp.]
MKKLKTASWILFDFAETVFSASIISVFFPLWVVNTLGGSSYLYSFVYSGSVIISILAGIITAKLADEYSIKDRLFKLFVAGVMFSLYLLYFVDDLVTALSLFFIMNILYQQSLIFYNSLLNSISSENTAGVVSGFGVGIGYIGGIFSMLLANYLSQHPAQTFLITALIFTLFAFPSLLFISLDGKFKEKRRIKVKNIVKDKKFLLFLLSVLLLTDAAHGLIIFMSVYLNKVFEFSQNQIVNTIAFAGIFAVVSAPLTGLLTRKVSSEKLLLFVFIGWVLGFILLYFSNEYTIYFVASLFGVLLASLWTLIRVVLIGFSPEKELTTRFAFMALSERMASVVSPLTWGIVVLLLGETVSGYKTAALILGFFPLVGLFIYTKFLKHAT